MYAANDYLVRSEIKKVTWVLTFGGSIMGHLMFFALVFFFPGLNPADKNFPTVIDIDLVSVTEQELEAPLPEDPVVESDMDMSEVDESSEDNNAPEPEPVQQPVPSYAPKKFRPLAPIEPPKTFTPLKPKPEIIKPEIVKEPETEEPEKVEMPEQKLIKPIERPDKPSRPVQPKIKRSLKKRTIKREQIARNRNQRQLSDTLRKLKQKVRIDEAQRRIRQTGEKKSSVELMDIYKAEVMSRISKNWAVSLQMVGVKTNLSAIVVIKIMKNGYIQPDMWFEKKSGNDYFDECVIKAVKKSNPLPPLPGAYLRPVYGPVGLKFTPSGLQ